MLFKDTKFTHIPSRLNILHVEDVDFGSLSYLYVLFWINSVTDIHETFYITH